MSDLYLTRIIRLTATAGFLQEPKPGNVAHTPLSAPFVANPSFLDAVMFLAESVAPAALQMANESAYNLGPNTTKSFHTLCNEQPKLSRQWSAYLQHAAGLYAADSVVDILAQMDRYTIGNTYACIVEARLSLCSSFLNLSFI